MTLICCKPSIFNKKKKKKQYRKADSPSLPTVTLTGPGWLCLMPPSGITAHISVFNEMFVWPFLPTSYCEIFPHAEVGTAASSCPRRQRKRQHFISSGTASFLFRPPSLPLLCVLFWRKPERSYRFIYKYFLMYLFTIKLLFKTYTTFVWKIRTIILSFLVFIAALGTKPSGPCARKVRAPPLSCSPAHKILQSQISSEVQISSYFTQALIFIF